MITNLLNQTYQDFELIIVNDGSTDGTKEVLSSLENKYDRIRIINKENGGVSSARNAGIEEAKGEFIFFIDDDDNVPLDYIANFMKPEYEDIDLIIDSYSRQTDNKEPQATNYPIKYLKGAIDILTYVFGDLQKYPYCFFPIGKRFRKSILKSNKIEFNTNLVIGEDRPFVLDYIRNCKNSQIINDNSYIIKSESSANYRLSQGAKPVNLLWETFLFGYNFLIDYNKEYNLKSIRVYADNFIVSKVFEYIFSRYSKKIDVVHKEQLEPIYSSLIELNIPESAVKNPRIRYLYKILKSQGLDKMLSTQKKMRLISIMRMLTSRLFHR